ncbi:eryA [Symbiodinium sp. CCMP2456]|nr:eryA [Symbiodinium sp. CCMP2456]
MAEDPGGPAEPVGEGEVQVVIRDLTGKTVVQCSTCGSAALRELAQKTKEAKPEWKHRGIKFVCDGMVVACDTKILVLVKEKQVSLTAIAENHPSFEEVLHECQAMFLMHVGEEAQSLDEQFTDLGVDSLTSLELHASLQGLFDVRISSMAMFDYPTIREISEHVYELLEDKGS